MASLVQLIVIPLLIVAACAGVILGFFWLTRGSDDPASYLAAIRDGGHTRRWQAASDFAARLAQRREVFASPAVVEETSALFDAAVANATEDYLLARYLARCLGLMGDRAAVPALIRALAAPDVGLAMHVHEALGHLGGLEAWPHLLAGLAHADPAVRKTAAWALGQAAVEDAKFAGASLGTSARQALGSALEDPDTQVRWNAALALAAFGDPAGSREIARLLDRRYLRDEAGMDEVQQRTALVNALRAVARLRLVAALGTVRGLARSDPEPLVRRGAQGVLDRLEAGGEGPAAGSTGAGG
ncbi:MAG: HEAT repeat domain-containing protein [Planctomycetes bacterium]|nr:HEAT repeat domain-containing protein [Planctomycetota bacterium]